jgi:dolichol-phosphate mannosyltransferase
VIRIRDLTGLFDEDGGLRLFLGYLACAGAATLVDIGLLYALTEMAGLWYLYSAAVSYTAGMVTNYTLNKYLNFKNKSKRILPQFGLFVSVALVGLMLNQVILYLLVRFAGLWYMMAKFMAICMVMVWSFYGHRRFTFRIIK